MSYAKQSWVDGALGATPINADRLNHMEDGIAAAVAPEQLAPVATSGAYGDLSGAPTISPVGLSGAYADLTGLPVIPAAYSDEQAQDAAAALFAGAHTGISFAYDDANNLLTATVTATTGIRTWNGASWTARPAGIAAGFVTCYSDGSHGSTRDANATDPGGLDGDVWEYVTA